MTSISNVNFTANKNQTPQQKKEVVYVSKNPNAVVNATGVVAGTAGMVGGAVLGGTVGLCKLPGGITSAVVGADYAGALKTTLDSFKSAVTASPELSNLVNAFKTTSSPQAAEEIITIAKTLTERLDNTFKNDAAAKAVINKVLDPILNRTCLGFNVKGLGMGLTKLLTGWIPSCIPILGKLNPSATVLMSKGFTESLAAGFADSAVNLANLSPEEKQAWGRVAKEIKNEFMTNPKLKRTSAIGKAIGAMFKDFNWITQPLKNMQTSIVDTVKNLSKGVGNAPIKTIGKWSAIGAAACGTLSTLGWFGLKKGLMTKENEKAIASQGQNA